MWGEGMIAKPLLPSYNHQIRDSWCLSEIVRVYVWRVGVLLCICVVSMYVKHLYILVACSQRTHYL